MKQVLQILDADTNEVLDTVEVTPVPTVAELATSLGCTVAEIDALSAQDRGDLIFDLILQHGAAD